MILEETIKPLLEEQLNEIIVSEILIIDVLPIVQCKVSNKQLIQAIKNLKTLMRRQQRSIQGILDELRIKMRMVRPEEFEIHMIEIIGLTDFEGRRDETDLKVAQRLIRLFHLHRISYDVAVIYARTLGYTDSANRLQELMDAKDACLAGIDLITKN